MKARDYIVLGVSFTAIACSLIALSHTCPREMEMDYLGIIIGILAFLTTLLLGWNIYSLVDFNQKMKEINKTKADLARAAKVTANYSRSADAQLYNLIGNLYNIIDNQKDKEIYHNMITCKATAIALHSQANELGTCWLIANELAGIIAQRKEELPDSVKKRLALIAQGILDDQLLAYYRQVLSNDE